MYYVRRLRLIDEVPILVENSYIPFATFPGSAWVTSSSLSSTISKKSAISPSSRATAAIPVLATREQAELLQVAPNSLLLRVQSISYAQNQAIVDFSEIYQNTSKYNVKHITRR